MDVTSTASAASASSAGAMTTQQQGDPTGAGRGVSPQGLRREEETVFRMHMGEAALIVALNAWCSAKDRDILTLRADLHATQVGVSGAFTQAQEAVQRIVDAFRDEAHAMRQTTFHEAQQSVSRLELVVAQARSKFDEQDARFTAGLVELAGRLQSADAWAQAEPARVAALMQAAPVPAVPAWMMAPPEWLTAPPGMSTPPRAAQPGGRLVLSPALLAMSPGPQLQPSGQQQAWEAARDAERAQQQQPQHQQPPLQPDPWAQFRRTAPAAAPASWLSPAAQRPGGDAPDAWASAPGLPVPQHFNMASPPIFGSAGGSGGKGDGKGGYPRELRINQRDWGDSRKLDVSTTFDNFQVWKDRAMMHLSKERPDVRALLSWAETQSKEDLEANLGAQAAHHGVGDLASAEYAIHDGIKGIVVDSFLNRARNCPGRGCELWRALVAEWSGDGVQVRDAKARRYIDPPRAKDIADLWSKLPAWERMGEEVVASGFPLVEWLRNTSLEKLLPTQLLATLISRGTELKTYAVRLAWVKTMMEHSRGIAQAAAYGPGTGKDKDGDVYMNSVQSAAGPTEQHPDGGLAWALATAVEQGDWAQQEALQIAILAVKGGGKGGFRKGGLGKGKPGPGNASSPQPFNGECNYCHIWGHRKQDCRKHTAMLAEKGKGGAAKGEKGAGKGGKGGKGPPAPVLECAAGCDDGDWAAELAASAGDDGDSDEWAFDTLASLAPWTQAPARRGRRGGRTWRPFDAGSGPATAVHNSYAGLNSLQADAIEEPTPLFSHIAAAASASSRLAQTYTGQGPTTPTSTYTGQGPTQTFLASAAAALHCSRLAKEYTGQGPYAGQGPLAAAALHCSRLAKKNTGQGPYAGQGPLPLNSLVDDADVLLGAVAGEKRPGGRFVEAVVDSGAVHSVAPPGAFPGPVRPSLWSRAGRGYRAANGTSIKNMGEIDVPFATAEGHRCRLSFQVAGVEQPLLSVSHLTSAGNMVQLRDTDGTIVNTKTGRSIALERRGGIYIMKMWVPDAVAPLPFGRQGA